MSNSSIPNPWAVEGVRVVTPMGIGTVTGRRSRCIVLRLDDFPQQDALIADDSPEVKPLNGGR